MCGDYQLVIQYNQLFLVFAGSLLDISNGSQPTEAGYVCGNTPSCLQQFELTFLRETAPVKQIESVSFFLKNFYLNT